MNRELEKAIEDGKMVKALRKSDAWKKVIKPDLKAQEDALVDRFLIARTYEEFIAIQQRILSLRSITECVKTKEYFGNEALNADTQSEPQERE